MKTTQLDREMMMKVINESGVVTSNRTRTVQKCKNPTRSNKNKNYNIFFYL